VVVIHGSVKVFIPFYFISLIAVRYDEEQEKENVREERE
jgi:hypothetical protein